MRTILYGFALALFIASCGYQHDQHAKEHTHAHEANKHEHRHEHDANKQKHQHGHEAGKVTMEAHDEIIFTPEQAAKTEFEVRAVTPKRFHQVVKASGQILPAPGDESLVVATGNGVVSFSVPDLAAGKVVQKGETLFQISSRDLAEGDFYEKAKSRYEQARANYERARTLVQDKIISQKAFEEVRAAYEQERIAFDAIAARRTSKGVGVPSPLGGHVKQIHVRAGEYVTVGQPLATVAQNRRLVLRAEVPERHYSALKHIRGANFCTPYDQHVYELSDLNGRLLSYGRAAGQRAFYLPVSFEFDNQGAIIPGSFVEVFLLADPVEDAITVPVSALTNEMGYFYVYVQVDEEGYRKQEVTLGGNDGREVHVLKGLKAGDRVVTKGAYQVKMAASSGAIPHGHEH